MTAPGAGASGTTPRRSRPSGRSPRAVLWLLQSLLAVCFAFAGWGKIAKSSAELLSGGPAWIADVPLPLVRIIGLCELLGALGLLLPAATRRHPELTPVAATGLTSIMVLALAFHLYRGDTQPHLFLVPAILGLLSAVVAWARFRYPSASGP